MGSRSRGAPGRPTGQGSPGRYAWTCNRHNVEHEIYHVARDPTGWCQRHIHELADIGQKYDQHLGADAPDRSGPLAPLRTTLSELAAHRPEPGLLLLADLRRLHRKITEVSLGWELLAQSAQAAKKTDLLALAERNHPHTLRQLTS